MAKTNDRRDRVEEAQWCLAGKARNCEIALLRIAQALHKGPPILVDLLWPAQTEIEEALDGIRNAQVALANLWRDEFMT